MKVNTQFKNKNYSAIINKDDIDLFCDGEQIGIAKLDGHSIVDSTAELPWSVYQSLGYEIYQAKPWFLKFDQKIENINLGDIKADVFEDGSVDIQIGNKNYIGFWDSVNGVFKDVGGFFKKPFDFSKEMFSQLEEKLKQINKNNFFTQN